jgi:molybdopterin-containing oxidoreductase family membrane subunit
MSAEGLVGSLPYGVGRWTRRWLLWAAGCLVILALGVSGYAVQLVEGLVVTGMRDIGTMRGAAWGLYIAFDIYFVGVSFAGITLAALIRLLDLERLRPVSRMGEMLAIIGLLLGGLSIMPDLGRPARGLLYLPWYGRPMSPFFGTFTLVLSGYFFASLVYFYLDGRPDAARCAAGATGKLRTFFTAWAAGWRGTPAEWERRRRSSFWLALAILPLLVAAHSTLGFVFGLQVGRLGWFSALQAPGFVALAGVSGLGLLIVIAAIVRQALGEVERLSPELFRWLANALLALVAVYLYFLVVEWLTASYAEHHQEARVAKALLAGPYAWLFWASLAMLVAAFGLLVFQYLADRHRLGLIVVSGVLVNVAAMGKRVLIVLPSQTHGMLLPYLPGSYVPTWVELSIIAGLFALGTLLYMGTIKIFPILPVSRPGELADA